MAVQREVTPGRGAARLADTEPRVQRAREAADYPTTGHDMHGILCELLDVVDEQRAEQADRRWDTIMTRYAALEDELGIEPDSAEGRAYFTGYQDGLDAGTRP